MSNGTRNKLREAAERAIEHHERRRFTGDPEMRLWIKRSAKREGLTLFSHGGPVGWVAGTARDVRGKKVTVAVFKAYEVLDFVGYAAAAPALGSRP